MYIDLKCLFCGKQFSHDFSANKYEVEKCPHCGTIIGANDNFVIRSLAEPFFHNCVKTQILAVCGIRADESD